MAGAYGLGGGFGNDILIAKVGYMLYHINKLVGDPHLLTAETLIGLERRNVYMSDGHSGSCLCRNVHLCSHGRLLRCPGRQR